MNEYVQWSAAVLGILGSWMLAQNKSWSKWAWPIWTLSNVMWIAFSIVIKEYGILLQNGVFLGINIVAMYKWFGEKKCSPS